MTKDRELYVKAVEIRGFCPVFKGNERIVISGPEIDLDRTDRICIHALAPIMHFAVALREGVPPEKLGLAKKGDKAYVQCPDPADPYTYGGTVIFEIGIER
jgi:uncharacterized repeat protein (TIGR04076 family)